MGADSILLSPRLEMIRSATPFPLVSLFFMFIGFILSNIGHIRPHRTILAFVSGIFFILSGKLCCFLAHTLDLRSSALGSPGHGCGSLLPRPGTGPAEAVTQAELSQSWRRLLVTSDPPVNAGGGVT